MAQLHTGSCHANTETVQLGMHEEGTSALYQTIKTQTCSESLLTLLSGSVIGAVCMSYLLFCWQTQVRDPPFISRCANHSLMQIGAAQPLEFVIALAEDPVRG